MYQDRPRPAVGISSAFTSKTVAAGPFRLVRRVGVSPELVLSRAAIFAVRCFSAHRRLRMVSSGGRNTMDANQAGRLPVEIVQFPLWRSSTPPVAAKRLRKRHAHKVEGGAQDEQDGGPLLSVRVLRGLRNNIYKNSSNWMLRFYVENTPGGRRGPLWGRDNPREVVPKRHKIE